MKQSRSLDLVSEPATVAAGRRRSGPVRSAGAASRSGASARIDEPDRLSFPPDSPKIMSDTLSTPSAPGVIRGALRGITLPTVLALGLAACGGSSSGGATGGAIGSENPNPDGTSWFTEDNQGGEASKVFIEEMFWGRLVDVYDFDGTLQHRDYLVGEDIRTDGIDYQLDINAVTEQASVTILHAEGTAAYASAFDRLDQNLGPILVKGVEGDLPPFSFVPRNAAIGVRFSDLIEPGTLNAGTVRVSTGNPPTAPFEARLIVDPNHGGTYNGEFRPTRILIDPTVSELEAEGSLVPINSLGFPASKTTQLANLGIEIPTQLDFGTGQFQLLTNPVGNGLVASGNGPVDFTDPSLPIQRGMRSGGDEELTGDANNGFLLDLNPPRLVGSQPGTLLGVAPVVGGGENEFEVTFQYASLPCATELSPGDVIRKPGVFAEVVLPSALPDAGQLSGVRVRLVAGDPIDFQPGTAQIQTTFDKSGGDQSSCYVSFSPLAGALPTGTVSPDAQVVVRFSEPMSPSSLQPFDTFMLTNSSIGFGITNFVVGEVLPSSDLKEFRFVPALPLDHTAGASESFYINLVGEGGATDLAGNPLAESLDQVQFSLDAEAPTERNGNIVLRFNQPNEDGDEFNGTALNEYSGQFLQDPNLGLIRPRPVERSAAIADPTQAVPGGMIALTTGVQTPLSPLGSRMMTVYRYFDVGYSISDSSSYNMDVEGLNWAPLQGQVQADFFEEFEVNLAHSKHLPDEHVNPTSLLPTKISSGLKKTAFVDNVLADQVTGLVEMHAKPLGYLIDPIDLFTGGSGTKFLPYPVNRGLDPNERAYYTWRDTSIQLQGGALGNGIPTFIEADRGLIDGVSEGQRVGDYALSGNVPTIGLPLLAEFKCFPSDQGVGLNSLDCAIAINSSPRPYTRVFSTGGYDTGQNPQVKNPDTEVAPTGGYNANPQLPQPLGATTPPNDNVFYFGQLDIVVRVSRVHTRWLHTNESDPDYLVPVLEPRPDDQPAGSSLTVDYRGSFQVNPNPGDPSKQADLNADYLNVYGDEGWLASQPNPFPLYGPLASQNPNVQFPGGDPTWKTSIDEVDGAEWLQARFTFISNTETGLTPELSAFGVAFLRNS